MKIVKRIIFALIIAILVAITFVGINGYIVYHDALKETSLEDKVKEIREDESFTKLDAVSQDFKNAVVAVEDHRFYHHWGVDFIGTARAILVNITSGSLQQGGSTITQQLAKNMYFSNEVDVMRKIAEIFMAFDIERHYSKDEILELYINNIYYGDGYYCIKEASEGFFDKEPKDMTRYEATLLAGVPNAPSVYAPTQNLDLAEQRQDRVLKAMVEHGYLSQDEADDVKGEQKT